MLFTPFKPGTFSTSKSGTGDIGGGPGLTLMRSLPQLVFSAFNDGQQALGKIMIEI
jgi:hypothetical protein